MKFDYIIQNPPYNGQLHLKFLSTGYNLLSETGKMVIIEPATWLINIRKNTQTNYNIYKDLVKSHVYKVIIDNYNTEFNTGRDSLFSITYIDKNININKIHVIRCGESLYVNTLNDCNIVGEYNIIWNILTKISNSISVSKLHIVTSKTCIEDSNIYYLRFLPGFLNHIGTHGAGNCGLPNYNNNNIFVSLPFGTYFDSYIRATIENPGIITNTIPLSKKQEKCDCIYGTKNELLNFHYFVNNNKLYMFIAICMIISQAGKHIHNFVPWLVDKQYTDDEINELFKFTSEEIELINKTVKKFERSSPWFKRYMCGPSIVSDKEVQKFIENL